VPSAAAHPRPKALCRPLVAVVLIVSRRLVRPEPAFSVPADELADRVQLDLELARELRFGDPERLVELLEACVLDDADERLGYVVLSKPPFAEIVTCDSERAPTWPEIGL
jgi:hypothetical protein